MMKISYEVELDSAGNLLLTFLGPALLNNASETEIEGILFVLRWVIKLRLHHRRVVIYSDSGGNKFFQQRS